MGAKESGSTFLAGVLAKLPAELQAQVKAAFDAPEASDALIVIGDGTLARSDYSKQMDELREKTTEAQTKLENLNAWYEVNQQALEEWKVLKGKGTGNPPADPPKPPTPPPAAPEDLRKVAQDVVNEAGQEYVGVSVWLAAKAVEHLHRFGEPIDASTFQNPKLGKPVPGQPNRIFSLEDAYNEKYGERVAAKQKEAQDQQINAEVDKRLAERMKAHTQHPFPLRGGESPSPLDVLTTKEGPAAHTIDSALAEYDRLQMAKGA